MNDNNETALGDLPPVETVARDLAAQGEEVGNIVVQVGPTEAFMLIGQLQLALRHPSNVGESAAMIHDFIGELTKHLPASAQTVVAHGWPQEETHS